MSWLKPSKQDVATAVREAIASNHETDQIIERHQTPDTLPTDSLVEEAAAEMVDLPHESDSNDTPDRITGFAKLSKLVDDDFPFDESQLAAIEGMVQEPYACMTGAAGTGKTTSTKKFVDRLLESSSLNAVNMKEYWRGDYESEDGEDDYDAPEDWIPAVVMVSFTGRATQQIKKNFPEDWHGNIMTIHRMLGFYPERYEDFDDERGEYVWKRRFVPTYTADCLLPWDVIIIDEAGMLGLDLWHQLYAACKPGTRIYMIGDINQLPPVHGKPIFGFALAKWPSWELTHVHRQQGKNNPIVDNAWRVLNGRMPVSEGRFQMMELLDKAKRPADAVYANRLVRAMLPQMRDKGIYDPIRDTVIVPINGEDGARGYQLGQLALNRELALIFNPKSEHPRYIIDGGREHKQFAVGDKVMATKNDWEAGITNGMTGIIESIRENAGYGGDSRRFGQIDEVRKYMESQEVDETIGFSLEELNESMEAIDKGMKDKKEKADRGPSSHVVTVRFGTEEHGQSIPFSSLSEVGSLMTAYAVTCHKMQGGESPTIIIVLHESHKAMLYREWLYTAVTRASEKCIVLYTRDALKVALNKQKISGSTLKEKVASFNRLIDPNGMLGAAIKVNMPESTSRSLTVMDRAAHVPAAMRHMTTEVEKTGGVAELLKKHKAKLLEPEPKVIHHFHTIIVEKERDNATESREPIEIRADKRVPVRPAVESAGAGAIALVDARQLTSQWGAYHMMQQIELERGKLLLTHQPKPAEKPMPAWMMKMKGIK